MPVYKLILFKSDGSLRGERPVIAASDEQALEQVAHVRHPHAIELWCGPELVMRFDDGPLSIRPIAAD